MTVVREAEILLYPNPHETPTWRLEDRIDNHSFNLFKSGSSAECIPHTVAGQVSEG